MKFYRRVLSFIVRKLRLREVIAQLDRESQLYEINKALTADDSSIFSATAVIKNLARNPAKILVGGNTFVEGELLIFHNVGAISIGEFCYVGSNSKIWSGEKVEIGNHVLISHDVFISDTNSHETDFQLRANSFKRSLSANDVVLSSDVQAAPVLIEDHVWINPRVCILKGVHVGKGAIIAAGSVVTKSVPPFTLVAGNPAVVVKSLR